MTTRRRELTTEERMEWGECPVCEAEDGEPCDPNVGFPLGLCVGGRAPDPGAHMGRLQQAPKVIEVREVR